jgi:hypothetical protein
MNRSSFSLAAEPSNISLAPGKTGSLLEHPKLKETSRRQTNVLNFKSASQSIIF